MPEPSFIDSITLLGNPLYLGSARLALLPLGFGAYRFIQRSKKDSGETSFLESRLQPDSFFGASGGQRIDTRDAGGSSSSMTYSLSQLDAIGDVDPVAEADVYLAYGRDLQAEEILKEAMRSNPERLAIRTKLLEVYAKRRDIKGFELLATQLFALTRGEGEEWAKAQELGAQIDPENPLYQRRRRAGAADRRRRGREPLGASTLPQSIIPVPSQLQLVGGADSAHRDSAFDASTSTSTTPTSAALAAGRVRRHRVDPPRTGGGASTQTTIKMPLTSNEAGAGPAPDRATRRSPSTSPASRSTSTSRCTVAEDPSIDAPFGRRRQQVDPLSRKLELAEEFQRIGDKDGARDLLREVLATASGAAKTKAQGMLDDLSRGGRAGRARRRRSASVVRVALGIAYRGSAYSGWQSQPGGRTVQDHVDARCRAFADRPLDDLCRAHRCRRACAQPGRPLRHRRRARTSTPGCAAPTATCPRDIAVQWCRFVPATFHSRASALGRRYAYVLLESPVRPALESRARRLDLPPRSTATRCGAAGQALVGTHDFSAFRSAECQALSPVKTLRALDDRAARRLLALRLRRRRLPPPHDPQHHGLPGRRRQRRRVPRLARRGARPAATARSPPRPSRPTACTSSGPYYDAVHAIPERTPAMDWLP